MVDTSGAPVVRLSSCRYPARAWSGEQLVADSHAAVRVEQSGQPAQLWFPLEDTRRDLLRDDVRVGEGPLAKMVVFDPVVFRVELVDGPGPGDPDTTLKRFPTWGDASDLVDVLDVRPLGDGRFESVARASLARAVVEGSQMLGQSIVAAGRHVPGRRAVAAHMAFLRAADAARPLLLQLTELSNGRTFSALRVDVTQDGRLCAAGSLLLDSVAPDLIRHEVPAPDVPGPYQTDPYDMGVTGRDVRMVDNAYTDDPAAPVGPPVIDTWVRFRDLPDDPYLHAGLMVQFTGHVSIAAALRAHEGISQREAHRSISTAINAITVSLHSDVRADRWMLYHHHSTFAGDGMTHSACRVHSGDGRLLASFTVEAMVRAMGLDADQHDPSRAL